MIERRWIDLEVGDDLVRVTAMAPQNELAEWKAKWILCAVRERVGAISETEFRAWLGRQPGGGELLERLRLGGLPVMGDLAVDPLNAVAEARSLASLSPAQSCDRPGGGTPGSQTLALTNGNGGCGCGR